jgi:L-ascorbate metabolism protein UlaG (beta-lactamase superfamily)
MVIETSEAIIFVDPVGDVDAFEKFPDPDIILITDIHGDHLDPDVVNSLKKDKTTVIGPEEVIERLEYGRLLKNEETGTFNNVSIEAIPMYNLTKERLKFHSKGRGNGYVITADEKKIYISGDTEDIPEMRKLKNIDYAFVCMNLPYTMTVDQAASAVLEMKPKVVFPYHYRGTEGLSDIEKFKELVSKDKNIEVRLLDWYVER